MQPYYDTNGITIYHADCREILPHLPEQSADLVLTDPPYADETHQGARSCPNYEAERVLIDFASFTVDDLRTCFNFIGRIGRAWVVSFMDYHHVMQFEQQPSDYLRFVRFGIWDKPNGSPQFSGDRPAQGWEAIAILHREGKRMRWNGGGHRAVWRYNIVQGTPHKAAKPVPLVAELMQLFSNPAEIVVDPFGGIGTTAYVAKQLGRRCIMIEREERYCEIAARWLETNRLGKQKHQVTTPQPSLF